MIRLLALTAIALAPATVPAVAGTPGTSLVRTADLDLSNPHDLARLQSRVDYAVKSVCGSADDVFPEAAKEVQACERDTRAKVETTVAALEQGNVRLASR